MAAKLPALLRIDVDLRLHSAVVVPLSRGVWSGFAGRRNALARNDRWGWGSGPGNALPKDRPTNRRETLSGSNGRTSHNAGAFPGIWCLNTRAVTRVLISDLLHRRPAGSYYRAAAFHPANATRQGWAAVF